MKREETKILQLLSNYPQLEIIKKNIIQAHGLICRCYEEQNKVLLCGNGGSAADCEHIVGELMKGFLVKRRLPKEEEAMLRMYGADETMIDNIVEALPAISLTNHISFLTAFCNDNSAENVFAQQLYVLGNPGDVLWAISTSGNSTNIINAAIVAKAKGMKIIGMTGKDGGKLAEYSDVLLNAPSDVTARIQEMHTPIYHTICAMLEVHFFAEKENA